MNGRRRPRVNLASQPVRNRRFYRTVVASIILLFALLAIPCGLWFFRASSRAAEADRAAVAADERLYAAERERNDFSRRADALRKSESDLVAGINAVLDRKAFSIVDFFVLLEEALPPGSYLTSLSPVGGAEGRIDARFKVVTSGLPELMSLIAKLETLKFSNVASKGESRLGGQVVSEIGLTYERTH
jgi:hypothetical protein